MKKIIFFSLVFSVGVSFGQSQEVFSQLVGRICQTDSMISVLRHQHPQEEDSLWVFNFKTPDANKFGLGEYDYESFIINFEQGSVLMVSGYAYGVFDKVDITDKKATLIVSIHGDGDRKVKKKFENAIYNFVNKKGRWALIDVTYN